MKRAADNAGYGPGSSMIVFEVQAPPPVAVQLASLRAAFPAWHIDLGRQRARGHIWAAVGRKAGGPACRSVVASGADELHELIIADYRAEPVARRGTS